MDEDIGRNALNIGMGALGGAAWLASYPVAITYGAFTGQVQKYKRGFRIPIPYPMSPIAWTRYYVYRRRHVSMALARNVWYMALPVLIGKSIQYNLWDPLKHLLTLDMDHLAGGAYVNMPKKRDAISKRGEKEYRELTHRAAEIASRESDSDSEDGSEDAGD